MIVNHDQNKLAILNIITYVGSIYNSFIISSFKKRKNNNMETTACQEHLFISILKSNFPVYEYIDHLRDHS